MNVRKDKLSSFPKEKSTKYETIFDHNATEKELGYITNVENKKEYLEYINYNLDKCYFDLSNLYRYRCDRETSRRYYSMMSEKGRKEYERKIDKLMSFMIP